MKILILTIATNKYIQFVERLYDNIEEKFLNGHEIQGLLFTEHDVETSDNIKVSQIDHEPWPMPTLKRYNYVVKEKDYISQFDYCYYFDVDMGIVDKVGDEVLDDLVATMHPYQSFYPKEQRTYDRNPKSLAYVPSGEEGELYYAGGFNGGSTKRFMEMAEILADRVTKDLENDVIRLESMIILYEQEIEQLKIEKKELSKEITFLKTQLDYLSLGNPNGEENVEFRH